MSDVRCDVICVAAVAVIVCRRHCLSFLKSSGRCGAAAVGPAVRGRLGGLSGIACR